MAAAVRLAVLCGLVSYVEVGVAQDDAAPDREFLEYLGSWEGSDEDWVALTVDAAEEVIAEANETATDTDESVTAEKDDES